MSEITVEPTSRQDGWTFKVTVSDGGGRTSHSVNMSKQSYEKLIRGKECSPEHLVKRSFEFLLEREPKESILGQFDITLISRYFPEYDRTITGRL